MSSLKDKYIRIGFKTLTFIFKIEFLQHAFRQTANLWEKKEGGPSEETGLVHAARLSLVSTPRRRRITARK